MASENYEIETMYLDKSCISFHVYLICSLLAKLECSMRSHILNINWTWSILAGTNPPSQDWSTNIICVIFFSYLHAEIFAITIALTRSQHITLAEDLHFFYAKQLKIACDINICWVPASLNKKHKKYYVYNFNHCTCVFAHSCCSFFFIVNARSYNNVEEKMCIIISKCT